jgi:hypothetical protein
LVPIEAKSGTTLPEDALAGLRWWQAMAGQAAGPAALVFGGDEGTVRAGAIVYSWAVL